MALSTLRMRTPFMKLRVYIGIDPGRVTGPAIILFPLCRSTFCCGLAGIMTLRNPFPSVEADPIDSLAEGVQRMRMRDGRTLLAAALPQTEYLSGSHLLEEMERSVGTLKRDAPFSRLFFSSLQKERLDSLMRELKVFLSREEIWIEEQAGAVSSADMELINSRLLMLRDILWTIEQDVLANVEKIVMDFGLKRAGGISPTALLKYKKLNHLLNCLRRLRQRPLS